MADLVAREGSVAGAGRAYAAVRGTDPSSGERVLSRWALGESGPRASGLICLVMAREGDSRTLAQRQADVDAMAARFAQGFDLWTGRPAAPRRKLEDLAREAFPLDAQLRARAHMTDRREDEQERRGRGGIDEEVVEDEPANLGASVLRVLVGGVA